MNPQPEPPSSAFRLARQLGAFVRRALAGFFRNGGVVLAGAVAYNGLLSIVPTVLLATTIFARFVDRQSFVAVIRREIAALLPRGQAEPIDAAITALLDAPFAGGVFGLVTLIFFSTLAFRTLEHALDVIFAHRRDHHGPRSLLSSMLIALGYVAAIGFASLLQTLASVNLERLPWLAARVPRFAGLAGLVGMSLVLGSLYLVMPLGRGVKRAALIGGFVAALLWQGVQHALIWYLENISSVNMIYGSLAGIVVVLFSFELATAIVLLAAQMIAEIEKSWRAGLHWYEVPPRSNRPGEVRPMA
jgi:membrane protein